MHEARTYLGVDLGGTQVRAATANAGGLRELKSARIDATLDKEDVFQQICRLIDAVITSEVDGIGIGVPGLVKSATGMIYDVVNIPAWKSFPLGVLLHEKYRVPVTVNNDANCFALGEWRYGSGMASDDLIGLTLGTGVGGGIIINGALYEGPNGGAGEFGMMPYLAHNYEYYCSGQFFLRECGRDGISVFEDAGRGDSSALEAFNIFGQHLGNLLMAIIYAYDIGNIVIGGSVSASYSFFQQTMFETLSQFGFHSSAGGIHVRPSLLANAGVLGAAALPQNR